MSIKGFEVGGVQQQYDYTALDNIPANLVQDANYVHTDNNYTNADKTKLLGIEAQANKTTIDATLTHSGQAADAKATGDEINDLKSALESNQPNIVRTLETLSIPNGDSAEHWMTISDFDQTYENFVEITNMGAEDARYGFKVFWNGNATAFTFYQVISPGETKTYEIPVRQNIRTRTIQCQSPGSVAGQFVLKRIESPYIESLKAQGIWVCDASASGLGVYQMVENAVKWMKKSSFYTEKTKQCVIYIRNGIYTIDPTLATADTFWSVILTAQHDVAFIGESRDQTIIQMTCPTGTAARIFDISGNSRLAHLTIKNLAGDSYAGGAAGHNPYAVHIDSNNSASGYERTVVEDCYIYSSMFTPIGAGLWNKQTQVYRNCVFEFGATYSGFQSWGALYIHGPSQASATECALEIDNCTMISTNGQKALALPDVSESLQYTDIPVTIQRCIGYSSNPNNLTDVSASRVALTPQSALNSVAAWNA